MNSYKFDITINSKENIETILAEVLCQLHDMQDNQLIINNFVMNYYTLKPSKRLNRGKV